MNLAIVGGGPSGLRAAEILAETGATVILFDDYTERPEYHVVEKYATLVGVSGRMALFKKDKEIIISDIYIDLMRYSSISA